MHSLLYGSQLNYLSSSALACLLFLWLPLSPLLDISIILYETRSWRTLWRFLLYHNHLFRFWNHHLYRLSHFSFVLSSANFLHFHNHINSVRIIKILFIDRGCSFLIWSLRQLLYYDFYHFFPCIHKIFLLLLNLLLPRNTLMLWFGFTM